MKSRHFILLLVSFVAISTKSLKPEGKTSHRGWEDCILITKTGDSVKAQIKNKKDYSAEGSVLPNEEILLRQGDGKEVKSSLQELTEILIPGKPNGSNHYLILNTNVAYPGRVKIYRVVTDGLCKLLYTEMPAKAGAVFIDPNNHAGEIALSDERLTEQYYIYYNHKLMLVHVDDDYYLNSISKNDCIEIFKSCPEVINQLNDKKAKSLKLNLLIGQFNACLGK